MSVDIETKVREIISAQLEVPLNKVQLQSSFLDDLTANSLTAVELGLALEENFGIEIPDEEFPQIKTVKDMIDYIKKHAKG